MRRYRGFEAETRIEGLYEYYTGFWLGLRDIIPITENNVRKDMENQTDTGMRM